MKDDPVRHERLAAIGKNGAFIRLHKGMTFSFVNRSDRKTMYVETETIQFSPISNDFVMGVTL